MYQGQRILLIDDDPNITYIYSAVFSAQKYNFAIATNGNEGLELVKREKPSLILLDIMLPDISGFDVLTKLKSDPETSSVPVWMLTNLQDANAQNKAKELGATEFLIKVSFTPKQVVEKINTFFNSDSSATSV